MTQMMMTTSAPAGHPPLSLGAEGRGQSVSVGYLLEAADNERLSASTRAFARSLAGTMERRRLTPRQFECAQDVIARSRAASAEPAPTPLGDFSRMVAMFETAMTHLKRPRVRLMNEAGRVIMLCVAGDRSNQPGMINVTDHATGAWYGRIKTNGTFQPSRKDAPSASTMAIIARFAASPVETARDYGRLTGSCCLCGRTLSDPVSVSDGVGPVCATRFGFGG